MFEYKEIELPPNAQFKISPSSISKFFSKPHEWFREQILGEVTFEGSTSTELGTIVHFIAEQFIKTGDVDREAIQRHIDSLAGDIDGAYIMSQWQPMGQALIDYLIDRGVPDRSEEPIYTEVQPGYYVGGTADAAYGSTLIDFKTTSNLTAPTEIPHYYRYQLLAYAYIYNKMGIYIDRIRIVWVTNHVVGRVSEKTNKPMKDYPSTVTDVTEYITEADMDFIESILNLIVETVQYYKQHPELAYILFKDMRLKDTNVSS